MSSWDHWLANLHFGGPIRVKSSKGDAAVGVALVSRATQSCARSEDFILRLPGSVVRARSIVDLQNRNLFFLLFPNAFNDDPLPAH